MVDKVLLARLHDLLAQEFLTQLTAGATAKTKDGDVVTLSPSAPTLNVIRQFLKDNGVDKASDPEGASESPFAELVRRTNDGLAALQSNKKAN